MLNRNPLVRSYNKNIKLSFFKNKVYKQKSDKTFVVYVPFAFRSAILKGSNHNINWLYSYSKHYWALFPIINQFSTFRFSVSAGALIIYPGVSNSHYNIYIKQFLATVGALYKPVFKKLKFRGKGYYIYKGRRNTIAPQFGFAHRVYIYSSLNHVKFIGKTTVIIFGLLKSDILKTCHQIQEKRTMNIFTGRGVRFARQVVYKKQGKVSSYR